MIKRFLSQRFTPSQLSKIYILGAVGVILVGSYIAMSLLESEPKERKTRQRPTNIVTEASTRQMGLDAVNDKATQAVKDVQEIAKELEIAQKRNKELEDKLITSTNLAKSLTDTQKQLERMQNEIDKQQENRQEDIDRAIAKALENAEVDTILGKNAATERKSLPTADPSRRPSRNQGFSYSGDSNNTSTTAYTTGNVSQNQTSSRTDARVGNLFAVVESTQARQIEKDSPIYVPKGSILTGVLITGLDAPTASSASDTPIPVLVRLKKEAILPNYAVVEEVRECFAIMAGYGDLSSERAFLRGESITCVREDGDIIEASFKAFAVGEDGKNGLKGTLISRNSTLLANAMMAGFASGMAAMFDVNPVPVISTSSSGSQQYQDVFSTEALQGGAAKGASQAIEKLADYYLKLADAIHPIIEVGAGRVVDMVITEGAKL
ncbi:hypothetical protein G6Z92_06390 [Vibrio aestuarianus subsp. cardii]|uniref:TrbI/VirB10 family protein n=1 Tax=Vibrio aestuarianus TaxID=28171 RepID=UPI0015C568DA|nr:TrbI/VirB10 family protein [Vibrio aestuarianus]NGZ66614.1 hypothetical protein [Vibrio aestuarianus subsp. cardii]